MVKTKITETTEKYDKDGKLVERIIREETTDDDTIYYSPQINPIISPYRYSDTSDGVEYLKYQPTCHCSE
ncbi:hypothetical protein GKG47_09305 [Lactonifactor sp. BIOML-A3]|uniref:hypothetical protein n=1 Tax=unclassified Lactonifactor TaxID=2636670 RepID=UPI0012AEF5F9|nr:MULTISPECIES: hypothetical protein [unclassified Lactonifactor]MSA02234.1 hypothetical protein [Lactonifactor sp. BIOML-A5]MSA08018.1 hypothetical protein [Lactonifactor sp. BIOML-A4]MSA12634.1 hypothetical protein [Lactonifactor sp. BIOML-A3]MSA16664.1 hypothetical protein [Lactonifactor sp. BIOML-A2]MSA37637.1 hypothetical protein [Lactonifactor sp. BIOML-A1]